ncbi:MAG: hypothetical protein ISP39_05380 [Alphaproteobacteria bacterium]|nr:hypothetical protein [Alphaproteobacteria bacterium]MBL6671910.1 hypothetical protein [Alphaproteobacteria bacterium]
MSVYLGVKSWECLLELVADRMLACGQVLVEIRSSGTGYWLPRLALAT